MNTEERIDRVQRQLYTGLRMLETGIMETQRDGKELRDEVDEAIAELRVRVDELSEKVVAVGRTLDEIDGEIQALTVEVDGRS